MKTVLRLQRSNLLIPILILLVVLAIPFCHVEGSIKAIVFDCDGVLVDTEGLKFQAWKEALQSKGVVLSPESYQPLVGKTSTAILRAIAKEFHFTFDPKIIDEKDRLYSALQRGEVKSLAPMIAVVLWAKKKRENKELLLGVATSASRKEVLVNLNHLKIRDIFDVVLSGKEDLSHYQNPLGVNKPQPYIYLEMSKRLGVKPNECLVFEDSRAGVCAAKKAGCLVIAVPNEWTAKHNFDDADLILDPGNSKEIIKRVQIVLN